MTISEPAFTESSKLMSNLLLQLSDDPIQCRWWEDEPRFNCSGCSTNICESAGKASDEQSKCIACFFSPFLLN